MATSAMLQSELARVVVAGAMVWALGACVAADGPAGNTQASADQDLGESGLLESTDAEGSESGAEVSGSDGEMQSSGGSSESGDTEAGSDQEEGGDETDSELPDPSGEACRNIPALPRPVAELGSFAGTLDFVFDAQGRMLSSQQGVISRVEHNGDIEATWPYPGNENPHAMRLLPDGTLLVANPDARRLDLVAAGGMSAVWAEDVKPLAIAVDFDSSLYLGQATGSVIRIDALTGEHELLYEGRGSAIDGISFSPDHQKLLFADDVGVIHSLVREERGGWGEHEIVAETTMVRDMKHLTTDACANLYAADQAGAVWRISRDGRVAKVADLGDQRTASLNFGSGLGGWKRDHLYVSSIRAGLFEIDMGVAGKPEPHL